MTDQLILSGSPNMDVQTIDFGGDLNWQRNDASPVILKSGRYRFTGFDATTLGGPALFEIDLPRANKLGPSHRLEIQIDDVIASMSEDKSGIPDFHTVPRFLEPNYWGGFTKLTMKDIDIRGLSGIKIQGGIAGRTEGKLVHVDEIYYYDPNSDIYIGGREMKPGDVDMEKYPELIQDLEPMKKYAALERWGNANWGGRFSRHAINLRYFFGLLTEPEQVLIENILINTLQAYPGAPIKQIKRMYADLVNTMITSSPGTIRRDGEGIVRSAGVVVRRVGTFGHYTPERKNSGTHGLTDQVNPAIWLGSGNEVQYKSPEDPTVGYYRSAQGVLFDQCIAVQGMNTSYQSAGNTSDGRLPGFPAADQGNYWTDCKVVAGPYFIGLEDADGNPIKSQYNSRGMGVWPPELSRSSEFRECEVIYYNTRQGSPYIANYIDGRTRVEEPGNHIFPLNGPGANISLDTPVAEIPKVRARMAGWFASILPADMRAFVPFADGNYEPDPDPDPNPDIGELEKRIEELETQVFDLEAEVAVLDNRVDLLTAENTELSTAINQIDLITDAFDPVE